MHILITLLTVLASLKWGDWKVWRDYHASMLFISVGGLLYEYIVRKETLWKFQGDIISNELVVIIYAVITMPISVFLYLSHFPDGWWNQIGYIFIWSVLYIGVEWVLDIAGRISYQKGWSLWHSFIFDIVMFSVIAIHQRKPIYAYLLSLVIIPILIVWYDVPFAVFK